MLAQASAGSFFEQTIGQCREGNTTAAASVSGNNKKSASCKSTNATVIDGDLQDFCQQTCLRTNGCEGFQIYNVEYRGTCTAPSSDCDSRTCELMMKTTTVASSTGPDDACPAGFDTQSDTNNYAGRDATNDHNNLHGNGDTFARCFTKKPGQAFDILKPVVSFAGALAL